MPDPSSKAREHRMRVLENQARVAAQPTAPKLDRVDPQLRIPLIVEVKGNPVTRRPARRARRNSGVDQPELGEN